MKSTLTHMKQDLVGQLSRYHVVLRPDEDTPEWWAGAPSVVRDKDGTFYLAARMREGNSPRGRRGYEIRILRSADGYNFETIHQIRREDVGVPGFERSALVINPETNFYRLYACAGLPEEGWSILRFDDVYRLQELNPATARVVLSVNTLGEEGGDVRGYKDPVIFWDGNRWQMFVIGFDTVERIHHFVSEDGDHWNRGLEPGCVPNRGWHSYFTRPASVLPLDVGYLFVYEGSHPDWEDPDYNIATGLAYTLDLQHFVDLTWESPILKSTTPGDYHTWRYSHWLCVDNEIYVYFEAARPNNTNEIRLATLLPVCSR